MNKPRRTFLIQTGIAATAMATAPSIALAKNTNNKGGSDSIIKKLSGFNDAEVENKLAMQVNNPGDRWDGGVMDIYEVANAHSTNDFLMVVGTAYASPFSKYYLSQSIEKPMERAINCLLNVQHADGTIDLHSTNFHSTPDTAFLVNYLSSVYVILRRLNQPGLKNTVEKFGEFFKKAGECFTVGGVHTANHRWVVSSALARVNSFFPAQKYVDRIDRWFSEGIDLDSDGQYTERSVSIYSPTCDNMFITIGRLLKREELHNEVRKNLDMTLHYIQPGGEVLTDASDRQDNARTGYINGYYYAYRYFAIKDKNPVYASVCNLIETLMPEKITRLLPKLLEDPIFEEDMVAPSKIPDNYFKRFEYSGLFRIRHGEADVSVIERNPTFLSFMKGKAVMQSIRLGSTFFGSRGQFTGEHCEFDGEKIVLIKSKRHGYFQPFPEDKISGDGIYSKMPREERELSEPQTIDYKVTISESGGKVSIDIEVNGTEHVLVSCEMSFRPGGVLSGVTPDKNVEDSYFLESGMGQYTQGGDVIKFGPGIAKHKWGEMRGMLPKQKGNSVYITGYTPFKHTIELS
jgi:hypothetical protein